MARLANDTVKLQKENTALKTDYDELRFVAFKPGTIYILNQNLLHISAKFSSVGTFLLSCIPI